VENRPRGKLPPNMLEVLPLWLWRVMGEWWVRVGWAILGWWLNALISDSGTLSDGRQKGL
jgi:hypothetical protein